jgi:hypothetical protein
MVGSPNPLRRVYVETGCVRHVALAQIPAIPDAVAIEQKRLVTMQSHALVEPKKRVAVQRPLYAMKSKS